MPKKTCKNLQRLRKVLYKNKGGAYVLLLALTIHTAWA